MSSLSDDHQFLAPNEYSFDSIGIQHYFIRPSETEQLAKSLRQAIFSQDPMHTYRNHLDTLAVSLKSNSPIDIERCMIYTRLRVYLNENAESFANVLHSIQCYLRERMSEGPLPQRPQSEAELFQQHWERHRACRISDRAYRMRRFQFYDHHEVEQPKNAVHLQSWIQRDWLGIGSILNSSTSPDARYKDCIRTLANDSFLIIQHPTPAIATHTALRAPPVTAPIYCRILSLLPYGNNTVTVDDIVPVVVCLSSNARYKQPSLPLKVYTSSTASDLRRDFLYAELSTIDLSATVKAKGVKKRIAQLLYHIEFRITVKIRLPNWRSPHEEIVTLNSAPFGLISNAAQDRDLFPRVFIKDQQTWPPSVIEPNFLTIPDISDSLRRYFIQQTGIEPKPWTVTYIRTQLRTYDLTAPILPVEFYTCLAKIMAQIDDMARRPILSQFHFDGLFLGICDVEELENTLQGIHRQDPKTILAMRYGKIKGMRDPKDVNVRLSLMQSSCAALSRLTFEKAKFQAELARFIMTIALTPSESTSDYVLCQANDGTGPYLQSAAKFGQCYYEERLAELCPYKTGYSSITRFLLEKPPCDPVPNVIVVVCPQGSVLSHDKLLLVIDQQLPQHSSQMHSARVLTITAPLLIEDQPASPSPLLSLDPSQGPLDTPVIDNDETMDSDSDHGR